MVIEINHETGEVKGTNSPKEEFTFNIILRCMKCGNENELMFSKNILKYEPRVESGPCFVSDGDEHKEDWINRDTWEPILA